MDLLNFTTNSSRDGHNLETCKSLYEFDDVQVKVNDFLTVTIDGIITLKFDYEGCYDDRTGETPTYFIDSCDINIMNIYDEDSEMMNLSTDLINSLKYEIQNALEYEVVENN